MMDQFKEAVAGVDRVHVNLAGLALRSPADMVSIRWIVDGSSGSTQCPAWRGQFAIDRLEEAGYTVLDVTRA